MRPLRVLMALCLVSLIATYEQIAPTARTQLPGSATKLKKEGQDAYNALTLYTRYYKEELRQHAEAGWSSFDQQFMDLRKKISEATWEARAKLRESVNEWRGQKEVLEKTLKEVKATCVAAWEATKKQIGERIEDLKELYNPPSSANS